MVIVLPDTVWEAEIERVVETRLRRQSWTIVVDDAPPSQAVARARGSYGGQPLAYLAQSDALALEAIAAGADDSMCFALHEVHRLGILVDRTAQRAALRFSADHERTNAVQAEKLAALGAVVAGVAHEITNPLAAVCLSAEFLKGALAPMLEVSAQLAKLASERRSASAEELARLATLASPTGRVLEGKRVLDDLLDLVDAIAAIVRDLRIYAHSDEDEKPQLVNVADLVDQVLRIAGNEVTTRAHVERDYEEGLPELIIPRSRVVQVLTNILINAGHALQEIERPVHKVRIAVRADQEAVAISISDSGPGIAPDAIERIFDPFFTTKREGRGTGLGLPISRSILQRLGGELVVESVHGSGATFIAIIPLPNRELLRETRARSSLPPPRAQVSPRRLSILIVDDDERLLRIYPRVLRDRYDVFVADEGQEAIEMIASGMHIDLVMTDLTMPVVDGEKLYDWLSVERPELARRTLFVSGGERASYDFLARLPNPVLEKPVSGVQLMAVLERLWTNSQR
jgi:signal transduction histidine kinase